MLRRFFRSVMAGSLVAAGPGLFFTLLFAAASLPDGGIDGPGSIGITLLAAILPLLVTFPVVLVASIFIGLPTAFVLRRVGRESVFAYCTVGGIAGVLLLVPLAILENPSGWWIAIFGLLGGAATGYAWSRGIAPTPLPDT